jgi:hypothetical protein
LHHISTLSSEIRISKYHEQQLLLLECPFYKSMGQPRISQQDFNFLVFQPIGSVEFK